MKNITVLGLSLIILSVCIPSAHAQSLDSITKPISIFASDVSYHLRSWFMSVQAWGALYLMGDINYHDYLVKENDKLRAYHSVTRQMLIDSSCCKPSACVIDPTAECVTVCVDCGHILEELNKHYSGIHNE